MNIFKRITNLFSAPGGVKDEMAYLYYVRCSRCGEKIRGRVDLRNDLSIEYGDGGQTTYFTRKTLIGDKGCYQPIEVELTFDERRNLVNEEARGGELITEEEFNNSD